MNQVTCPKCGGYVPGHATGAADICTCEPITTGDEEITRLRADLDAARADVAQLRAALQRINSVMTDAYNIAREAIAATAKP